jgi:hypothetical protein
MYLAHVHYADSLPYYVISTNSLAFVVLLFVQGLIDKAPADSPNAISTTAPITISSAGGAPHTLLPENSVLPTQVVLKASVAQAQGHLQLSVGAQAVAELVFTLAEVPEGGAEVQVVVDVSAEGEIKAAVSAAGAELTSVTVPAK